MTILGNIATDGDWGVERESDAGGAAGAYRRWRGRRVSQSRLIITCFIWVYSSTA